MLLLGQAGAEEALHGLLQQGAGRDQRGVQESHRGDRRAGRGGRQRLPGPGGPGRAVQRRRQVHGDAAGEADLRHRPALRRGAHPGCHGPALRGAGLPAAPLPPAGRGGRAPGQGPQGICIYIYICMYIYIYI